jgi:hypothetical protein
MEPDLIVATAALFAITCIARALTGSWLSPSPFFAIIWTLIVVLSLSSPLFGAPTYPVWAGSLWWIDAQILTLMVGDLIGQGRLRGPSIARRPPAEWIPTNGLPHAGSIVLVCIVCTFVYMLALDRIEGRGEQPPTALQLILTLHYAGGMFGGLIYASAPTTRLKLLGVCVLLPAAIFSLFLAGRTAVVAQFTFWFAGYCAMSLFLRDKLIHLFTKRKLAAAVVSMTLFVVVGILVEPLRAVPRGLGPAERLQQYSEVIDANALDDSWEFMKPGFFGHIASFSWYFERAWQMPPPLRRPGEQTFAGIYRLLGIELTPAIYTRIGGIDTNVFTIFKPIIEDYTLGGSFLVFLMVGMVGGWSYKQLAEGTRIWPAAILVMFYNNSDISGGWYFNYNSVTGAHVVVWSYLFWFQARRRKLAGGRALPTSAPARSIDIEGSPSLALLTGTSADGRGNS